MYVYIRSEPQLWTVGYYDPSGKWQSESDHGSSSEAAERVRWLNGDNKGDAIEIERLTAEHQAVLIWAKLVYRWLMTYFAVPPKFMKDVPAAVIRER